MTGHARISVLVADHDRWTRLDLSNMLNDAGFQVEQASNGVTALRIAEVIQPHIVVLRDNLPEIDAAAVLLTLKTHPRMRHCAVLQLQEPGVTDTRLEGDGCADLPSQPIELLAAVMNALEARRAGRRRAVAQRQVEEGVGAPMRVNASARGALPVAGGGAQAISKMRNAGRSGKYRFSSDIDTL